MTVNEDVNDVHLQANEGNDEVNVEQPKGASRSHYSADFSLQQWATRAHNLLE